MSKGRFGFHLWSPCPLDLAPSIFQGCLGVLGPVPSTDLDDVQIIDGLLLLVNRIIEKRAFVYGTN